MAASKGTYYGPGNAGWATVLPKQFPSPGVVMQMKQQQEAQRQKLVAEQQAKQRDANIKAFQNALITNKSEWDPYTDSIGNKVLAFNQKAVQVYGVSDVPDMSAIMALQKERDMIDTEVLKTNQIKSKATEFVKSIEKDNEIDSSAVIAHVSNFMYDDNNNLVDIYNLDPNKMYDILNKPQAYNKDSVITNIDKNIEENIAAKVSTSYETFDEKKTRSKYYQLDADGEIKYDPATHKPLYNITPELINIFKGKQSSKVLLDDEINKLKESGFKGTPADLERKAVENLVGYKAYIKEDINRQTISRPKGGSGDDDSKDILVDSNVTRNFEVSDKSKGEASKVVQSWVPSEYSFGGKYMDKSINVPSSQLRDIQNNKRIKDKVGDSKLTVTRVALMPVNRDNGNFVAGDEKVIRSQKNIDYKWYVYGKSEIDGEQNDYMIELDNVKGKIQQAFPKFDIDELEQKKKEVSGTKTSKGKYDNL